MYTPYSKFCIIGTLHQAQQEAPQQLKTKWERRVDDVRLLRMAGSRTRGAVLLREETQGPVA